MAQQSCSIRRRAVGFTLIELLVVLAIIALLVALLLPALQSAKQVAQSTRCLSNIRQMAVLAMVYGNENSGYSLAWNGYWEAGSTDYGQLYVVNYPSTRWLDYLFRYGNNNAEFLECPGQLVERAQAANYQIVSPYPWRRYYPGYLINMHTKAWYSTRHLKMAEFVKPGQKVLFTDSGGDLVGTVWVETWGYASCGIEGNESSGLVCISKRHKTGSNLAFMDGHAAWGKYEDYMPANAGTYLYHPIWIKYWDPDSCGALTGSAHQ